MNFSGTERFEILQSDLWARLTDMAFVSRTIPDFDRVERMDASGFACRVRPRLAVLTGSAELAVGSTARVRPERLRVRCRGKGIGAAVAVEVELLRDPAATGTGPRWGGTIVSREGLLKPVSQAPIQAAAQR